MKYALLTHESAGYILSRADDEQKAAFAEYRALPDDPRCRGDLQLQPVETATTVRAQDGRTPTTDGPYADTKEAFGAHYGFDTDILDEAIELAAWIPADRLGGAIEVRPSVER